MKKLEVKKIEIIPLMKVAVYILVIPVCLMFIVGLVLLLVGLASSNTILAITGLILGLFYPLLFLAIYIGMGALQGLIYNVLANKFGGLEIKVLEKTEKGISNEQNTTTQTYQS